MIRRSVLRCRWIALAGACMLGAMILAGCGSSAADPEDTTTNVKRAKVQTAADFFVAASKGDREAMAALVVDPESGLLDRFSGGSGEQSKWRWDGDSIVVRMQGQDVRLTVWDSKPDVVVAETADGTTLDIKLQPVEGKWKISSLEQPQGPTADAVQQNASNQSEEQTCFANQRTINGAWTTFVAQYGSSRLNDFKTLMAMLVGSEIKAEPHCPSGGTYSWDPDAQKVSCSIHGSLP